MLHSPWESSGHSDQGIRQAIFTLHLLLQFQILVLISSPVADCLQTICLFFLHSLGTPQILLADLAVLPPVDPLYPSALLGGCPKPFISAPNTQKHNLPGTIVGYTQQGLRSTPYHAIHSYNTDLRFCKGQQKSRNRKHTQ